MKTYFNLLIFIFLYQLSLAAEPVALVSKLRGSVKQKFFSDKKYRTKVQVNSPIFHETELKTNEKAFAKVVYLDDGTSISIYPESEIKIIGTRHGEKLYETLCTREEMLRSEDLGDFYKIPADNRDLNYNKYLEKYSII